MVQGSLFLLSATLYSIKQSLVYQIVYNNLFKFAAGPAGACRTVPSSRIFLIAFAPPYTQDRVVGRVGCTFTEGAGSCKSTGQQLSGAGIEEQVNQCELCEVLG
jgi:hypothetical protein